MGAVAPLVVATQLAWAAAAAPAVHAGSGTQPPGSISTIAGGVGGPGPARTVAFQHDPAGVTFADGALYVVDGLVRRVNPRTGWLTTPVGAYSSNTLGFSRIPVLNGRPATDAALGADTVAMAPDGNLAVADTYDYRVRVVAAKTGTFYDVKMTKGHIYTVAGDGAAGFSGDGGPATRATVDLPGGVVVDGAGNLVLADTGNNQVRVVAARSGRFYGVKMTAGDIYTVAGNGQRGFSGDGGPAVKAMTDPAGITVDSRGDLIFVDQGAGRVRMVTGGPASAR